MLLSGLPVKTLQLQLQLQLQKLFVQGYNLEVYDVIKYTRKHRATVIISRAGRFIFVT